MFKIEKKDRDIMLEFKDFQDLLLEYFIDNNKTWFDQIGDDYYFNIQTFMKQIGSSNYTSLYPMNMNNEIYSLPYEIFIKKIDNEGILVFTTIFGVYFGKLQDTPPKVNFSDMKYLAYPGIILDTDISRLDQENLNQSAYGNIKFSDIYTKEYAEELQEHLEILSNIFKKEIQTDGFEKFLDKPSLILELINQPETINKLLKNIP